MLLVLKHPELMLMMLIQGSPNTDLLMRVLLVRVGIQQSTLPLVLHFHLPRLAIQPLLLELGIPPSLIESEREMFLHDQPDQIAVRANRYNALTISRLCPIGRSKSQAPKTYRFTCIPFLPRSFITFVGESLHSGSFSRIWLTTSGMAESLE